MVVSEQLSTRDFQRIVQRLRGFFSTKNSLSQKENLYKLPDGKLDLHKWNDLIHVQQRLIAEIRLPHEGNFETFADLHAFEHGFSIYPFFPPTQMLEEKQATDKHKYSFFSISPHLSETIDDLKIQLFGDTALATLNLNYSGDVDGEIVQGVARGSVLFHHQNNGWKIVHEHWSKLDEEKKSSGVSQFARANRTNKQSV